MAGSPLEIVAFYGISSPWAFLGMQRLRAIARDEGVGLVLRPIRIIETNGGIPLRTRPIARQAYHEVELARWSGFLDIPLNVHPKYYPCRTIEPAARMVIAAAQAGLDAAELSWAIQRALWAEDRDIADDATLEMLAIESLACDGAALRRAADAPGVVETWHGNLAAAEALGIFGTPTYVVEGELFWGQDRLDFVRRKICALKSRHAQSLTTMP
ncbi:2-hydroxychromene-2-carboxylate isomerase [Kozakia baliensis]|nr:2-hydroxychromene-2-carboxylate isomerase [Kozakia baliensis]GEL65168.1 2-hydroxychromene-2-carboxylate isomerase [Kozakia baliensis]